MSSKTGVEAFDEGVFASYVAGSFTYEVAVTAYSTGNFQGLIALDSMASVLAAFSLGLAPIPFLFVWSRAHPMGRAPPRIFGIQRGSPASGAATDGFVSPAGGQPGVTEPRVLVVAQGYVVWYGNASALPSWSRPHIVAFDRFEDGGYCVADSTRNTLAKLTKDGAVVGEVGVLRAAASTLAAASVRGGSREEDAFMIMVHGTLKSLRKRNETYTKHVSWRQRIEGSHTSSHRVNS